MTGRKNINLELPQEFIDLCDRDGVDPEVVIKGFIADLSSIVSWIHPNPAEGRYPRSNDGYNANGSDERIKAREYYERCGYPFSYLSKDKNKK